MEQPGRATGHFPGQVQQGRSKAWFSAGEEEEEGRERSAEGAIAVSLRVLQRLCFSRSAADEEGLKNPKMLSSLIPPTTERVERKQRRQGKGGSVWEGRREKWSGYGGKETLPVPALPSPGNQDPSKGTRTPWEPPALAQGWAAPCHRGKARAEDAPNSRTLMSFPQSTPTPRHHQKIPRGNHAGAGWLPPGRSQKQPEEEGKANSHSACRQPSTLHTQRARPSASPSSPAAQWPEGDATAGTGM